MYIVLLLVISALGLLVTALTTANTLWAWVSVGLSVVAALLLVIDWLRARDRKSAASGVKEPAVAVVADSAPTVVVEPVEAAGDPDAEPAEEPTDASDLLVVSGLSVEVWVLDERPRYHLSTCAWLANRASIPLPVGEARQLGFTPCGRCNPDATLAAKHRARTVG